MRRVLVTLVFSPFALWGLAAALGGGCSSEVVGESPSSSSTSAGTGGATSTSSTSTTTTAVTTSTTSGAGGVGSGGAGGTSAGSGGTGGGSTQSTCGPAELCDPTHLGFDDNCDGQVDEGCSCEIGQAHFCFKGDPALHGTPGCFDGTELCTEQGTWGPCVGGFHAAPPDDCFVTGSTIGPHDLRTAPFIGVHLKDGTGTFSQDAVPGSEKWTVTCPVGVIPCPGVGGTKGFDWFLPIQSGEYGVTYTKGLSGGGTQSATYAVIVGTRGLRVELTWEHTTADTGVDLDLHVHRPGDTKPWGISPAVPQDCTWSNCVAGDFEPPPSPGAPRWFADPPAKPPAPVNWWLDPTPENNNCFYTPAGPEWQQTGHGCHNPRLDLDNITCDASLTDPSQPGFCVPENVNIDFPPQDAWTRIGVHYYNNHGYTYDVHPVVRIFCDGALAGLLGPTGYYVPQTPITFEATDGASIGGNRFWLVADVAYSVGPLASYCTVRPLHSDPANKTPFFTFDNGVMVDFGPPYPP